MCTKPIDLSVFFLLDGFMSLLIRKEVKRLKGYALSQPPHQIKLNQNESPYDLPPALKKRVLERLAELCWNRYPAPFCDPLRKKIAEKEGWDSEGVLVSGGSNILIQAVVIAASVKGKILTVTPGFSLYEIEGALLGNRVLTVPLCKEDFSLPLDVFLKRIKKENPQIVFLANPNAPTGNLFGEEDLLAVLKTARGLVVVDEAYYPFSEFTLRPHLKRFSNLILIRTFSKAFSLGGVRLGYLLGSPKVVSEVLKVVLPFSVGALSQAIGEVVLADESYVPALVREIIEQREWLYGKLREIPSLKVYPSRANFILFQTASHRQVFEKILRAGILIRDVSSPHLPKALRVTVGSPEENRAFLSAFPRSPADMYVP